MPDKKKMGGGVQSQVLEIPLRENQNKLFKESTKKKAAGGENQ